MRGGRGGKKSQGTIAWLRRWTPRTMTCPFFSTASASRWLTCAEILHTVSPLVRVEGFGSTVDDINPALSIIRYLP